MIDRARTRWLEGAIYITTSADQAVQWFTSVTGWVPTAGNISYDDEQGLFIVQISYHNPPLVGRSLHT